VRCVEVMCAVVPHTSPHKGIYYGEGQVVQSLREGCVPHTLRARSATGCVTAPIAFVTGINRTTTPSSSISVVCETTIGAYRHRRTPCICVWVLGAPPSHRGIA
jgi:hypothetical protein